MYAEDLNSIRNIYLISDLFNFLNYRIYWKFNGKINYITIIVFKNEVCDVSYQFR